MSIGSVGVLRSLMQKRKIQCDCLGTVFELPMTTDTLAEYVGSRQDFGFPTSTKFLASSANESVTR